MKKSSVFSVTTLSASLFLAALSRLSVGFSEWYAMNVYPFFRFVFSKVFGIFPFSAAEILLGFGILAVLAGIVILIVKLVKGKGRRKAVIKKALLITLNAVSALLLIFMLNGGINYNRRPFLDITPDSAEYTPEQLTFVYDKLLAEFNRIVPFIHTDDNGAFILTSDLKKTAPAAMLNLSEKYPRVGKTSAPPKPVITSKMMSRSAIAGIFSPFTVEANYNDDIPDSEKPFTVCHELSHLAGFMKEEEANFISFLACRESGDPDLMYSAYLSVLQQMPVDFEDYMKMPKQARSELSLQEDYWWNYMYDTKTIVSGDGEVIEVFVPTPLTEISDNINDGYLKANGQEDGTMSYGRMIDLVIAVYLNEGG